MKVTPRIAVFGGTGFLGRAVVSRLTGSGMAVRVVARHAGSAGGENRGRLVEYRTADIRDEAAVSATLRDADGVVNAVSLYVERPGGPSFEAIHVEGAERISALAGQAGVGSLVHISGIGAHEASASPYVRARARGEQRVRSAFPGAVILRPSVLFGPGDAFLRSLEMITRRLPVVPLFGRGNTRLQPVYVEDVAAGIERALQSPEARGRRFELGGAGVHTYREIIAMVLDHLHRRRLLVPVPFLAWHLLATVASVLPGPPLTRDQVILMETDNVVGHGMSGFSDLGITARAMEPLLGLCLDART
jgi:uncharacterized protein YbjT (DUF2867 family)